MRVLIVEDDDDFFQMINRGLIEEGFDIDRVSDGAVGLTAALDRRFDCVLLDVMLPGLDGVEVCRQLREKHCLVPVIMLTVKNEVQDRVNGLDAGADDYVAKPFSFEELLARIRVQIRRNDTRNAAVVRFGDLSMNTKTMRVTRVDIQVELTPKEYQLLDYFVRRAGQIVTEQELAKAVWGRAFDPQTNTLNVYLHRLRSKLHIAGREPIIETIRGQGYCLGEKRQ